MHSKKRNMREIPNRYQRFLGIWRSPPANPAQTAERIPVGLERSRAPDEKRFYLILYRSICGFFAALFPVFGLVFEVALPGSYDPQWLRMAFAALSLAMLALTYASTTVRQHVQGFMLAYFVLVAAWAMFLLHENHGHIYYVFTAMVVLTVYPAFFYTLRAVIICAVSITSIALLAFLTIPDPLFDQVLFLSLIPALTVLITYTLAVRLRLQRKLADSELLLNTVFHGSADALLLADPADLRVRACNLRAVELFEATGAQVLLGILLTALMPGDISLQDLETPRSAGRTWSREVPLRTLANNALWGDLAIRRIASQGQGELLLVRISDITKRKRAEQALAASRQEMIHLSRQAGMAEVAAGVMHNVGNTLNSLNVGLTRIREDARSSWLIRLEQLAALLREHAGAMPRFLTEDERGRHIPRLLSMLVARLAEERRTLLSQAQDMGTHVARIKAVVRKQQQYIMNPDLAEPATLSSVVDDALQLCKVALTRAGIEVTRAHDSQVVVLVDRHLLVQVLAHLIDNARDALEAVPEPDRRLTVGIHAAGDRACVEISDNGVGFDPAMTQRLFVQGFSTKPGDDHGFGLHNSATLLQAMGGTLHAHSDGPGRGATFTVELPVSSATYQHERARQARSA